MNQAKRAVTKVAINDLVALRWSPRAMDSAKPVARENLLSMLEAARWAPSCMGEEPWRFMIWDRFVDHASWEKAFDCLVPGNQAWVKNAALLMLSLADTRFSYNDSPNRYCEFDTGAACENLVLQAHSLNLHAHQMGGYDAAKISATFNIPDRYVPMSMIAVGHPAAPEILEGELLKKELAQRTRKPLETRFFEGEWGNPVKD